MMHFKKIEIGKWTGMTFTPQFHSIYCLSFHLKQEGMNFIADNFKISRIIWNINMIATKMSDVLVYPKKCLSKCKDRLQLTYEDLRGPALLMASQPQNMMISFKQKHFLMLMYDGGVTSMSPIEEWIKKSCQINSSPWHQFQVFKVLRVVQFAFLTQIKILVRTQHIINEVLTWIVSKDKGKILGMNCLLIWLH